MPSRNSLKTYVEDSYYHIYARGVNRAPIFSSSHDYVVFMGLLKRYLSLKQASSSDGVLYPHLNRRLELLAFCLMPNHFHLLIYQYDKTAMEQLMRPLMTSYSMYYNKKQKRTGHLFEGRYKASRITSDVYLQHISRYIHLNPDKWQHYPYSSIDYYRGELSAQWLRPKRIVDLFVSKNKYLEFVADYEDYKHRLDLIKNSLADA